MSTKEVQRYYYQLGARDGYQRRYPLWATLKLAEEEIAAAAYEQGFYEATGRNSREFRDSGRR